MFQFVIKEDTFTPWAEEKISSKDVMAIDLLKKLAEIFLDDIHEGNYVPVLSGTLEESAMEEDNWQFVTGAESNGLLITWTGEDNPNEDEWERFANANHEDYALANYTGFHWRTLTPQSKNHWVVNGIFDTFAGGTGMDFIGEKYLAWLMTGK